MQLITFIDNENSGKKTMWKQFAEHKGYMQAIEFAEYLLKNTIEPETFSVVVSDFDGEKNKVHAEYSLQNYINAFD